ncbi:MAG: hypothetical protein SFU53_06775, partial [Terrimicrobiaceae bacterium]|nr:hypothetical protein [Terrimicrobiaceae bacterium]
MADQLTRLCGKELKFQVGPALAGMEPAQVERIQAVVDLAQPTEFVSFLDCLPRIYPTLPTQHAVRQFSNLRSAFNRNAEKLGLPIRFEADKREGGTAAGRRCWFAGPNRLIAQAEQMAADQTADLEGRPLVRSLGILQSDLKDAQRDEVRVFVSYAHEGRAAEYANNLIMRLEKLSSQPNHFRFKFLADRAVSPGAEIVPAIKEQILACDIGLLLVSEYFLRSEFILEHELPHFTGEEATKPPIPVGLQPIDFRPRTLHGLERFNFFLGQSSERLRNTSKNVFYSAIVDEDERDTYAQRLFAWLEAFVDQHLPGKRRTPAMVTPSSDEVTVDQPEVDPGDIVHCPLEVKNHVPTRGHSFNLAERQELEVSAFQAEHAKVVVEELETWARDRAAPPFYAVLGEYGLGKTTTLQQLTRKLLTDRKTDPRTPLPIYIDLRDYVSNEPRGGDYVPTLEELLDTVIQRGWKLTNRELRGADLIRLVREQGAVILFDGLDEKLVHMDPTRTRAFIKTLWSVLPDATRGAKPASG